MKIILIAKLYFLIEWLTKINKILYESNKILIIQFKYCPIIILNCNMLYI